MISSRKLALASSLIALLASGCNRGPEPMKAPSWAPEALTDAAMQQLDKNSDGQLSKEELAAAPGLQYAASQPGVDKNNDGKLSRDEVLGRFVSYVESRVAFRPFQVEVLLGGRPVPDAEVKLVPEDFLGDVIPTATTTTGPDGRGYVVSEGSPEFVRIGMYRLEVSAPNAKLPAKTNLGVEVSPYTDPKLHGGLARFNLKR